MPATSRVQVIIDAKDNASRVLKGFQGSLNALGRSASNVGADFRNLGKIALVAGVGLAALAVKAGMSAARIEELGFALHAIAKANNISTEAANESVKSLRGMNIAHAKAIQITSLFIQSQLELTDATKLANAAKDLAVIAGLDSSEATETLTRAIVMQRPMLLKQFGIVKGLDQIYKDYTETTGRAAGELTELEKRQAFLNAILGAGEKVMGTYDAAMGSVSKRYRSLTGRIIPDFVAQIGKAFDPALKVVIDDITGSIKEMSKWMEENESTISSWGKTFENAATKVLKSIKFIIKHKEIIVGVLVVIGVAVGALVVSFIAAHGAVMLIISGIILSVAAVLNVINNFKDGIQAWADAFSNAFSAIKGYFEDFGGRLNESVELWKRILSSFIGWYQKEYIEPAKEGMKVLEESFSMTSDQWADALGQTLADMDKWIVEMLVRFDIWQMNTDYYFQQVEQDMIVSFGNWLIKQREWLDLFNSSWSVGMNFWAETTKRTIKQWAHETYITLLHWSERVWLEAYLPLQQKIRSFVEEKMNQWRVGIPMIWKEIADRWIFQLDRIGNSFRTLGGKIDEARSKVSAWWSRVQEARQAGGEFQTGGIVSGPIGTPVLAKVHAGERIIPAGVSPAPTGGGAGGITFEVNIGMYVGTETEKRNIARELYGALVQVAQAQNKSVSELMGEV